MFLAFLVVFSAAGCASAKSTGQLTELKFTPSEQNSRLIWQNELLHNKIEQYTEDDKKQNQGTLKLKMYIAAVQLSDKNSDMLMVLRAASSLLCGAQNCATTFFRTVDGVYTQIASISTVPLAPMYLLKCTHGEFLVFGTFDHAKSTWSYWKILDRSLEQQTTSSKLSAYQVCH